jgi:hypothetical protein
VEETQQHIAYSSRKVFAGGNRVPYISTSQLQNKQSLWSSICAHEGFNGSPDKLDIAATIKRLQHFQEAAEAAGRIERLLRTPKQLRAMTRYVRTAVPFETFTDEQMLNVARSIDMVKTELGQRLVQEGTVGSAFFVVLAGTFGVYQKNTSPSPYHTYATAATAAVAALIRLLQRWSQQRQQS